MVEALNLLADATAKRKSKNPYIHLPEINSKK